MKIKKRQTPKRYPGKSDNKNEKRPQQNKQDSTTKTNILYVPQNTKTKSRQSTEKKTEPRAKPHAPDSH